MTLISCAAVWIWGPLFSAWWPSFSIFSNHLGVWADSFVGDLYIAPSLLEKKNLLDIQWAFVIVKMLLCRLPYSMTSVLFIFYPSLNTALSKETIICFSICFNIALYLRVLCLICTCLGEIYFVFIQLWVYWTSWIYILLSWRLFGIFLDIFIFKYSFFFILFILLFWEPECTFARLVVHTPHFFSVRYF